MTEAKNNVLPVPRRMTPALYKWFANSKEKYVIEYARDWSRIFVTDVS